MLHGDGTPLSALAWLNTWLEGRVDGCSVPETARDLDAQLLVTELDGGLLLFNPDREQAHAPRLTGCWGEVGALEPLETRWVPRTP